MKEGSEYTKKMLMLQEIDQEKCCNELSESRARRRSK